MPQQQKRLYKGKDIDMLTALSTILTNAQANQPVLQKKRTNLTKEYLTGLETRLNAIIKKYLGIDNAGQLRRQTQTVYSIEEDAYEAVSEMKAQIESSFSTSKSRQKEVLKSLGYNSYLKDIQKGDVEALISLLYQYQENMTPDLQQELVAAGTPEESVTAVTGYAENLRTANISQESFKGTKKTVTAEVVQAYNEIFAEVMGKISKPARIFFPGSLPQQQLLSYSTILKAINRKPSAGQEPPAAS